jgi:ABC-type glycerol-3-phosphate transport system substrate-binding protein
MECYMVDLGKSVQENSTVRYKPLYLQIKDILLKKIVMKEFSWDQPLPSESALAKQFGISISTIRQAVSILVAEEYLEKKQGKGTFLSRKKRKIRFLTWLPETEKGSQVVSTLIHKFEEKNPELQVEAIPTTYPKAKETLMNMISAGEAPDVAQIVSHWTSYFASFGALEPLDTLLPESNLGPRSLEKDLNGGKFLDKYFSVAWGLCPLALVANKSVLSRAGIELPEKGMDLELFEHYCREITVKVPDVDCYGMCISGEETDFLRIYPFLQAFRGFFIDEENTIALNSEENIQAFQWLRSFYNSCRVTSADIFTIRKQFADNSIAFMTDGPWIRFWLEELTGEPFEKNFILLGNPVTPKAEHGSWNYNHALGICSQSLNKAYAARFIDAVTTDPDVSSFFYQTFRHLPVHSRVREEFAMEDSYNREYVSLLESSVCINSRNAYFEKAMAFCIDAVKKILFENADIHKELNEKEYYLNMLYYG